MTQKRQKVLRGESDAVSQCKKSALRVWIGMT